MKKLLAPFVLLVLALPGVASAHASPVEYLPASSATVTEAPTEVSIRFSERVERGASRIVVTDETGQELQEGTAYVSPDDAHMLSIPVREGGKGAYFVNWSVVSSDDGHFTKGGYTYFIGDVADEGTQTAPQVEVVQLSALPEATAIAVELLGNSLLLGALILFAFVLRPRTARMSEEARRAAHTAHTLMAVFGIVFVLLGALTHIILKTSELAALQSLSFWGALPLYLATVSGSATVIRAGAVIAFALVFMLRRSRIFASKRLTLSEIVLAGLLGVFAYFRATVSHATANPFHPEIGIAVNFLHLIAKDLSAGILIGLSALLFVRTLRDDMSELLLRGMRILALLLTALGPSAAYIVWLHLKDPANLSGSLWGERFLPLLVCAVLAVAMMTYHVLAARFKDSIFSRFLPYTLPAEAAFAVMIVFFSSLMIITSPPVSGSGKMWSEVSNDVRITLSAAPHEDGMALLTFAKGGASVAATPTILIDADAEGGLVVTPEERFPGGYVFPQALFAGDKPHALFVDVAQEGGYDARATFAVTRADLAPAAEGARSFDMFAAVMLAIGVASIAFAILLLVVSRGISWPGPSRGSVVKTLVGVLLAALIGSQVVGIGQYLFGNAFKRECVADGNSWHLMLPSRDGRPVSSVPAEGCMALGGSFHIADAREYRFLKAPGPSKVTFSSDLTALRAGVPAKLSFAITNEDGTPARLSIEHERLVHVIIIGKDMQEFAHVHPDDTAPLTADAIQHATFSVPFTFPKAGDYIIGIDYASGLSSRSEQFRVSVAGGPAQAAEPEIYPLRRVVDGYEISLQPGFPVPGQMATLVWRIQKDGKDVTDLTPYLAAAMHVAIVKDDFSEFLHAHGEVHVPGAPLPKVSATGVHNHAPPPPRFGPMVEAHPVFPSAGDYTIFAQFMHDGNVITAPFSLRVE